MRTVNKFDVRSLRAIENLEFIRSLTLAFGDGREVCLAALAE